MATKFSVIALLFIFVTHLNVKAYTRHKVIIVGAGASGIAAATRFLENNVNDIVILEAQSYYGGRINATDFDSSFVELGAEWCHGEEENKILDIMAGYDVFMAPNYSLGFVYSNGENINEDTFHDIKQFLEMYLEIHVPENNSETLSEVFIRHYDQIVLNRYGDDASKLKLAVEFISVLENYMLTEHGIYSWSKRSILVNYETLPGFQTITWKAVRYKTVLEVMMKIFEHRIDTLGINERILYNKEVSKIIWQHEFSNVVTIRCTDGTQYMADHVIFTPSLGVLKKTHENLFIPQLPSKKVEAIENLGYDCVMKIIVTFHQKWWNDSFKAFLVWSSEDKTNLATEFPEGPIFEEESWISRVTVVYSSANNPNALVAWLTGDIIHDLEHASEESIRKGIMHTFRKFFGKKYHITEPNHIINTKWCTHPNFLGTYSFETLQSRNLDFNANEVLSEPMKNSSRVPVVLFAGEATSTKHYSTVHGAIESGYREADRLINLFKYHNKRNRLKLIKR